MSDKGTIDSYYRKRMMDDVMFTKSSFMFYGKIVFCIVLLVLLCLLIWYLARITIALEEKNEKKVERVIY